MKASDWCAILFVFGGILGFLLAVEMSQNIFDEYILEVTGGTYSEFIQGREACEAELPRSQECTPVVIFQHTDKQ